MNGSNRNNQNSKSVSALDLLGKLKGDIKGFKPPVRNPFKELSEEEIIGAEENVTAEKDNESEKSNEAVYALLNSIMNVEKEDKAAAKAADEAALDDMMRKYMSAEEADKYSKPKSFEWEKTALSSPKTESENNETVASALHVDTSVADEAETVEASAESVVRTNEIDLDKIKAEIENNVGDDDVYIGQLHTTEKSDTTLNTSDDDGSGEVSGSDNTDEIIEEVPYSVEGGDDVIGTADESDSVALVSADDAVVPSFAEEGDDYTDDFDADAGSALDDTDVQLMVAFGMNDELQKTLGAEKAAELGADAENEGETIAEKVKEKEETFIEFTSPAQSKGIIGEYRKKYRVILLKLLGCGILAFISFLYENIALFGGSLPSSMQSAHYPIVNIMLGLQLLVLAAAIVPDIIIKGAVNIKKKKFSAESMVTVLVGGNILYDILLTIFTNKSNQASVKLYAFPVIVCILIAVIMQFFDLRREIFSFNIASSKNVKYAIKGLTEEQAELENEAFHDFLPEEASIFHIGRTNFLDNFYARMRTEVKQRSVNRLLIPAAVAVSVLFFIIDLFIDRSIQQALSVAQFTVTMGLPFTALLVFSYPFFAASKLAYANGSAIIGEESLEEYSTASAITFEDKDVFPSYGVIVKSIKTYGSGRIDNIIYNAASLFIKAGGPLAEVFEGATKELEHSDDVQIIDAVSGGLEATVDGAHIYCGKPDYIMDKGFNTFYDPDDETVAEDGNISVMYMALDGEIVSKFYIQYVVDPDFETTLRQLCKIGMCVGIKTFDPNIDEEMLDNKLRIDNYRLKILRCRTLDDLVVTEDRMSSGVISKKSAKALMQTYYLCDKVLYAMKTGVMIKSIAMVFSFVIAAFAILAKASGSIYSLYVALYQLVWIIPTIVVSKLCVGKSA